MQTVTKTMCKKKPPDQHLRLGVFAPDAAHVVTAGLFAVHICHPPKLRNSHLPVPLFSLKIFFIYPLPVFTDFLGNWLFGLADY